MGERHGSLLGKDKVHEIRSEKFEQSKGGIETGRVNVELVNVKLW